MKNIVFFVLFIFLYAMNAQGELPDSYYTIGTGTETDFYAYHRATGTLTLSETGSFKGKNWERHYTAANYFLDLKNKKVVRALRGKERLSGCFGGRLMRNPDGKSVASQNNKTDTLSILNLMTGECKQKMHNLSIMKFVWSDDGKWLDLMDRNSVSFYRMNPESMEFEKIEHKGAIDSIAWSVDLKRTLYVYRTKSADELSDTASGYAYYYVDDDGVQRKVDSKYPLTNPDGDVYFYTEFEDEQSPTTTFFDMKSGKALSRQSGFYLGFYNRYAVWLKNDWVFFQGANGVLNYRTGEFVTFGTELTPSVVPFSVSDGRYAMMYLMGEDKLMVYDLEERKYIESYEPFWREQ